MPPAGTGHATLLQIRQDGMEAHRGGGVIVEIAPVLDGRTRIVPGRTFPCCGRPSPACGHQFETLRNQLRRPLALRPGRPGREGDGITSRLKRHSCRWLIQNRARIALEQIGV